MLFAAALALAAIGGVGTACGSGGDGRSGFDDVDAGPDGAPINGLVSIDVSPADVQLVAGDTNQAQVFTATGHFGDGTTRDVTSEVTWKATPSAIANASGQTITPTGNQGGDATVAAFAGPVTGTAKIHVKLVKTVLAAGAAPGSEARFKGAAEDSSLAPSIAYPFSGVLVPPNLPPLEIQWAPAAGTDLFDVAISGDALDLHVITPCNAIGAGCGLVPDATTWQAVTATLGGAAAASVVVHGGGATAGKSGASAAVAMQIAGEPLGGGLYYFNTRGAPPDDKPGIYRYDFDTGKVGSFFTQGDCAGCHSLSLDGTKMLAPICATGLGCARPLQLAVVDVATKTFVTPPMPVGDSDTQTWSPDNAFYVTTPSCAGAATGGGCAGTTYSGGAMTLVDAKTNTSLGALPATGAMYPSFSNDGKKLVYAKAGTYKYPLEIHDSSIAVLPFDATKSPPAWGAETKLVTASGMLHENNYHPSFSPDDQWVVFSRSHCDTDPEFQNTDINGNPCDSYNDYTARTFVVPSAGGTPIELATANGAGRNTVSWPKWSPFKTAYKGGTVFWITVASTRDYGFRATHTHDASGNPNGGVTQLWLVAFDPALAAAGKDPGFAPLWLPFQDVASSNHIGQWTTKIVGQVN